MYNWENKDRGYHPFMRNKKMYTELEVELLIVGVLRAVGGVISISIDDMPLLKGESLSLIQYESPARLVYRLVEEDKPVDQSGVRDGNVSSSADQGSSGGPFQGGGLGQSCGNPGKYKSGGII